MYYLTLCCQNIQDFPLSHLGNNQDDAVVIITVHSGRILSWDIRHTTEYRMLMLKIILAVFSMSLLCQCKVVENESNEEPSPIVTSSNQVLSRQKRFPALGFLTLILSLLNSLLLVVQTNLVVNNNNNNNNNNK